MSSPIFVAFEGGEACGKSTQAKLFAERIGARLTREPGGTEFGEKVRDLFQHQTNLNIDARAEALLAASARAQHVAEVIWPAIESGQSVVTDRFLYSSLAYQGFGRGLDISELFELSAWATDAVFPNLTILIDIPREIAVERMKNEGRAADRFESEGEEFHMRVAEGYRLLAETDPDTWLVIDGSQSIDDVEKSVTSAFEAWCAKNDFDV